MKNSLFASYLISVCFLIATVVALKTETPDIPLTVLAISLVLSYLIYTIKTKFLARF